MKFKEVEGLGLAWLGCSLAKAEARVQIPEPAPGNPAESGQHPNTLHEKSGVGAADCTAPLQGAEPGSTPGPRTLDAADLDQPSKPHEKVKIYGCPIYPCYGEFTTLKELEEHLSKKHPKTVRKEEIESLLQWAGKMGGWYVRNFPLEVKAVR